MNSFPTVVVLTNRADVTADFLEERLLQRSISFLRLDTDNLLDDLLITVTPSQRDCVLAWRGQRFTTTEVKGVWNRRPVQPSAPVEFTPEEARLASRELVNSLWGLLLDHPGPKNWVNAPDALAQADYKIEQLGRARLLGLRIPETLLTSEIEMARRFIQAHDVIVAKAANEGYAILAGQEFVTWTSQVTLADLDRLSLAPIPMIFQEAITPKRDIRVTVVDQKVWCAEIRYHSASGRNALDWRAASAIAESSPTSIDPALQAKLLTLVRSYGLRFAAIDLVVGADDCTYFLELNANGQWGWLELECGFAIRDELIDALMGGVRGDL